MKVQRDKDDGEDGMQLLAVIATACSTVHLALRKFPRAGDDESVGRAPSFGDQRWESETLVCRTCSVFDGWCACNARH